MIDRFREDISHYLDQTRDSEYYRAGRVFRTAADLFSEGKAEPAMAAVETANEQLKNAEQISKVWSQIDGYIAAIKSVFKRIELQNLQLQRWFVSKNQLRISILI